MILENKRQTFTTENWTSFSRYIMNYKYHKEIVDCPMGADWSAPQKNGPALLRGEVKASGSVCYLVCNNFFTTLMIGSRGWINLDQRR